MTRKGDKRLVITLDGEHAAKLTQLAERTHLQERMLARSLLSRAIDETDVPPTSVVRILDGISGAFDRAQLGREQAPTGRTTSIDQL